MLEIRGLYPRRASEFSTKTNKIRSRSPKLGCWHCWLGSLRRVSHGVSTSSSKEAPKICVQMAGIQMTEEPFWASVRAFLATFARVAPMASRISRTGDAKNFSLVVREMLSASPARASSLTHVYALCGARPEFPRFPGTGRLAYVPSAYVPGISRLSGSSVHV